MCVIGNRTLYQKLGKRLEIFQWTDYSYFFEESKYNLIRFNYSVSVSRHGIKSTSDVETTSTCSALCPLQLISRFLHSNWSCHLNNRFWTPIQFGRLKSSNNILAKRPVSNFNRITFSNGNRVKMQEHYNFRSEQLGKYYFYCWISPFVCFISSNALRIKFLKKCRNISILLISCILAHIFHITQCTVKFNSSFPLFRHLLLDFFQGRK